MLCVFVHIPHAAHHLPWKSFLAPLPSISLPCDCVAWCTTCYGCLTMVFRFNGSILSNIMDLKKGPLNLSYQASRHPWESLYGRPYARPLGIIQALCWHDHGTLAEALISCSICKTLALVWTWFGWHQHNMVWIVLIQDFIWWLWVMVAGCEGCRICSQWYSPRDTGYK